MNADQLINELESLGVKLEVAGDRLRFAPREVVPEGLVSEMISHKEELLSLIKTRQKKTHFKLRAPSLCVPVVMPCEVGCNRNIAFIRRAAAFTATAHTARFTR